MSTNQKTTMELLKQFSPEFAQNQMEEKSLLFENEKYQKVPNKYKMLIGIGVAVALGSDNCSQMWTNMAKQNGATNEEIVEAMQIARYLGQSSANHTVASVLKNLEENK